MRKGWRVNKTGAGRPPSVPIKKPIRCLGFRPTQMQLSCRGNGKYYRKKKGDGQKRLRRHRQQRIRGKKYHHKTFAQGGRPSHRM